MVNSAICSRCGEHEESFFHCVRDCRFSKIIWHKIGFSSPDFFSSSSVQDWLKDGISCHRPTTFLAGLWWIWRHRNLMCLNNETRSVYRLNFIINSTADLINRCLQSDTSSPPQARLVRWNNEDHACSILNVDGSCIGDPIRTGFGGVIRNFSGSYVIGFTGFIDSPNDILFAELTALHHGLTMAASLDFAVLACYSDSLLAVNLILFLFFLSFSCFLLLLHVY
ncbi:putative ribonuclease H-like domain-containing protein [Medicago truncatula]|uniref:Putative ribonuclease H-like domain-containing protein n=1 Tax=Medicago truncatula TaxID=3880 RepID=A0A396I376_MEDTR|nr:putative ribonuclease H-like domain-containing protein [Medicago truncatula]